jgi:predicted NUDIX family phosphoesterase
MITTERVLVVPRNVLDTACPHTFNEETARAKVAILQNCSFLERDIAEHDFQRKQVIPYVVIQCQGHYLLIQRTAKQTETRLHHLYSLGVGGHVNCDDLEDKGGDIITSGMRREFSEEIQLETSGPCRLVGVINDDSTEVARLHVGFVYLLTTTSRQYTILEQGKYTASWKLPNEISNYYDQMESWAQIVHDYMLFSEEKRHAQKWEVHK